MESFLETLEQKRAQVEAWLSTNEQATELPLYSSVDIRDAGFKRAVVDMNLFPSGFNNLCEHGIEESIQAFREAILARIQGCRNILILAEEHTRNAWYLEHLWVLHHILERAGFATKVATFLSIQPAVCSDANAIELETPTGHLVRIYSFQRILKDIEAGRRPCFIVLNNDLTAGIPDALKQAKIPIYPSMQAGWHSRLKSHHFSHTDTLIQEFAGILGVDSWLFSCLHTTVDQINIHEPRDRQTLADAAADLSRRIALKYREHRIPEKPFVFIKADSGTYGMGVLAVEDPLEIPRLNRKQRKKLHVGKGARVISRYLLQEGIPSMHHVDNQVGEVCFYQVDNRLVGGFYRTHPSKHARESLNAKGMEFKTMCPRSHRYGGVPVPLEPGVFMLYRILARVAGIAAHREILQLETAIQ